MHELSDRPMVCPACGAGPPADARYCPACGVPLEVPPDAERRIVSVLFADLSGFTSLSEQLDPEEVRSLVAGLLDPLCEAVTRWGGHVDKFIGDCVMALFGAPVAYENEPERAVRSGLDMQAALATLTDGVFAAIGQRTGYRPLLKVGITTGPVVTGVFTGGGARDYTAVGDTVNVASRLEGQCEPGRVLVDAATAHHTKHLFEFGEERVLSVKGHAQPVHARYVLAERAERGTLRGIEGRQVSLVGRSEELGALGALWSEVCDGAPRIALVSGPAGIGKSRLAEEIASGVGAAGTLAVGRSYPYASRTPWEPIGELVRSLYGLDPETPAEAASAAIAAAGGTADERGAEALSVALGLPVREAPHLQTLEPAERGERISAAVGVALTSGVHEPRILVLEDLHWADRATLEYLTSLSESELDAPALLLLLARPPLPGEHALATLYEARDREIRVAPLADSEAHDFLDRLLEPHEVGDGLLGRIVGRSDGNPLFLEEMVKSLLDSGVLYREEGVCRTRGAEDVVEVPDSVESVLSTRIDALDADAKRVLQYASIVGRRFWSGVLAEALVQRPVDRELDLLARGALVRPQAESTLAGDREFLFEHLLLQEVAYGGLLKGMRAEMHASVAKWLTERAAEKGVNADEWIAWHWERSRTPERAVPRLEGAATAARERGSLADAAELLHRAVELAAEPAVEARLRLSAEEIAAARGEEAERGAHLDRLEALAAELEGTGPDAARLAGVVRHRRALARLDRGDPEGARAAAGEALEIFRAIGDGSLQGDALRLLGRLDHLRGRYPDAVERYQEALRLEREAGDLAGQADMHDRLGLVEVDRDDFVRGLELLDEARSLCRRASLGPQEARVEAHRATAFRWLGLFDEAEAAARNALDLARRSGSRRALSSAEFTLAMVLAARGSEEAVPLLREAVAEARDLKRAGLEARALLEIGFATEGEEAEETVRRALEIGRSAGLDHVEILGETRLAELALERDDLEEAERAAGAAIERLRVHRNVQGPEELVHLVQSRVLERAGRQGEAERHLDEALRLVREKAARIEDERLRRAFLSLDPAPEILAAGDAGQKAAP